MSNSPSVQTLRSLFRGLHIFKSAYESDGITEVLDPEGRTWSIWDLEYLYSVVINTDLLPLRQRQAIELFLVKGLSEEEVAVLMGIKESNPCGMYATSGLKRLLKLMEDKKIRNVFQEEPSWQTE